jgi:hypothetical protein
MIFAVRLRRPPLPYGAPRAARGSARLLFLFGLLACTLALVPGTALGQSSPDALVIPKISGAIDLDGRPSEPAWSEARSLPLVQHSPNFGEEPTEKTEILVGYTADYLYVGCRCYDRKAPSAPSFKRDYVPDDSDFCGINLDTFNDNENALGFLTTPTGLRVDFAVLNDADASGQSAFDISWNTFWNAEARQTEEGWFAELRIPVSSLRFDAGREDQVVMGLSLYRLVARTSEEIVFPEIPPKWGERSPWKPSQYRDVVFEDLRPRPPLRVTPYVLAGAGQEAALNDTETAYERHTDPTYDVGLDIKYGLTSNFTLDLTLNTDFAQVEADDQQVNLTRFPLFFPEKRRFFLERASTFTFGFGRPNRLFYSRRIGLFEGQQVRILGGARVVGRSGPWDMGVLNMQTAREPEIGPGGEALPSENFGVARVQREVINEDSNVGGILTSRLGRDGTYNVAYGLDGLFRLEGETYLAAKWAQTFQDGAPNEVASLDPTRLHLQWEDRSYKGLSYDLRYDRAGPRYEPGVGLELRDNYFRLGDRVGYGWVPGEESPIQRHRLNLEGEAYFRNVDGSLQSLEFGPEWEMTSNSDHSLTLEATRRVEDLRAPFTLSESARVPAGRYGFHVGEVSYRMPFSWDLRTGLEATGGSFYDGWRATAQVSPTWNASRYLRLSGFYQLNRIRFPDRDQDFTAHVGRLRAEVTPSVEYSVQAFVQYNSARDVVVGNLRFRYNPRQGTDLYLVYNERLNSDRAAPGGPRRPLSAQRTILLKYTYTFNW